MDHCVASRLLAGGAFPHPIFSQNRWEDGQSCPQSSLTSQLPRCQVGSGLERASSLVNVIKVFYSRIRSKNCPFLGWSQSSKHPTFQRVADTSVSWGNWTLSGRVQQPCPQTLSKRGDQSSPAQARLCCSKLPQSSSQSTELVMLFPCPRTLHSSPLSRAGRGPNRTCPVFANGVIGAQSQPSLYVLIKAAFELQWQSWGVATKPKMFTVWLFAEKDGSPAEPSCLP